LLIFSEIKLHFHWKNTPEKAVFRPFSPLPGTPAAEIFADFRKISAKIEFRTASKYPKFDVILHNTLIL